jgi:hypothetical protein
MTERYRLRSLGNRELLAALLGLVRRGNELTSDLLAHLAEVYERRLHLELGYPSLFAYCTQSLGLSESAAGRRIAAARVCRRFPEAFEHIASGALHLSALCSLSPHLNPDSAAELLKACGNKSARKVEELLAARFPKRDLRDAIRRLPSRVDTRSVNTVQLVEARRATNEIEALPTIAPEKQRAGLAPRALEAGLPAQTEAAPAASGSGLGAESIAARPAVSSRQRELEPLSADRFGVRFTADREFLELLEQVRALAGHRQPDGDLLSLMKHGLKAYLRELEKTRFAVGRRPRVTVHAATNSPSPAPTLMPATATVIPSARAAATPGQRRTRLGQVEDAASVVREPNPAVVARPTGSQHGVPSRHTTQVHPTVESSPATCGRATAPDSPKRGRHVPAAVAREVYLRDQGQCTFVSNDGRRCAARQFLELDHAVPWALGGETSARNLRLRCRAHNQRDAAARFGEAHVKAARAARETRRRLSSTRGEPQQSTFEADTRPPRDTEP